LRIAAWAYVTFRGLLDPLQLLWHLGGFFAPAVGTGLVAAALAKLLWRRELQGVPWRRLAGAAVGACAAVLIGGLVLTGRDGRVVTYAAMAVACGIALCWVGFVRRRR
jgi:hypothetical protein